MILYAHITGQDKRERVVLSYNVEQNLKEKNISIDEYLIEIMNLNPQFDRVYCR